MPEVLYWFYKENERRQELVYMNPGAYGDHPRCCAGTDRGAYSKTDVRGIVFTVPCVLCCKEEFH